MPFNANLRDLLEAGVHFGHQTARWNPKMKPYIFEQRNGIHIIDLQSTVVCLTKAYDYVKGIAARGQKILFLGTKKQAKEIVKEAAQRCGMYYVNERWLGGLLTNFVTIRKNVAHYKKIQDMMDDGSILKIPGKEASSMRREWTKLHRNLEGIKGMEELPAVIFVVDPQKEGIAVKEARKMGITVVAIADTNCDPDLLDYPIPGNDDAIRTIKLLVDLIADAVLDGKKEIVVVSLPVETKDQGSSATTGQEGTKASKTHKPGKAPTDQRAKEHASHARKQKTTPAKASAEVSPKKKEIRKSGETVAAHNPSEKA